MKNKLAANRASREPKPTEKDTAPQSPPSSTSSGAAGGTSATKPDQPFRDELWQLRFKAYVNYFYFERLASWYLWADRGVRLLAGASASATLAKFFSEKVPGPWSAFILVTTSATLLSTIIGFATDATTLAEIKVGWLEASQDCA